MPDLPSHISPQLEPQASPPASAAPPAAVSDVDLDDDANAPPGDLLSPAFTPPATPGTGTPASQRDAKPIPVDISDRLNRSKLLDVLPVVDCLVRARIPTTSGQEMFLHLYKNDLDDKEHLAIVFGPNIRSRSLDVPRAGETELDRMIRGAYTGRLYPGRVSSRTDTLTSTHTINSQRDPNEPHPPYGSLMPNSNPSSAATARKEAATGPTPSTPLVRIHSECYTGETVWSARCDCGEQLDEAARLMSLPSCTGGVIIYLRQEGRGIGLGEKLKAYNLQDLGSDTVEANLLLRHPADARSYGLATAMLCDLGLGGEEGIRLLTNNPQKISAVEGPNREVVVKERVAMIPLAWAKGKTNTSNEMGTYMKTKIERMGHMLQM